MSDDYDEVFGEFGIDEADFIVIDDAAPPRRLVQMTLDGRRLPDEAPSSQRPRTVDASPINEIAVHNYTVTRVRDRQEPATHHKLDQTAIQSWVFPTNFAQRDYQYNMIYKALFANVLVALPTGLGKTFIAAVVMVNWYRWASESKIVFLAPTKPLVAQQIEACYRICGIPARDIAEMTGGTHITKRTAAYKERRVFFLTPQTFQNDLRNGLVDGRDVSCLVVDEAHHATGNYAYVDVVSQLKAVSQSFRILALTATPGKTVEGVQEVVDNLLISQIEIRNDESLDIRSYTHTKDIETIALDLDHDMLQIQNAFASLIKQDLDRLIMLGVGCTSDPTKISAFGIRDAVNRFCQAAHASHNPNGNAARAIGTFVASMGQSMALLNEHGMRPFYDAMKALRSNVKGSKLKARIVKSRIFKEMMCNLEDALQDPNCTGHPKLDHLNGLILNHFQQAAEAQETGTRVMVFSSLRASTEVIIASLKRHHPLVKATGFYGQAKGKDETGMTQKEQLAAIQKFKQGTFNVLVATSVGEEGLDIGEIDMIICYDTSSSPARMLQRMGRTGRKRSGQVFVLCTKGKEETAFIKAKDAHRVMQRKIESGKDIKLQAKVPRIVPWDISPVCDKRLLELPADDRVEDRELKTLSKRKKQAKVFAMPDGVEQGFTTAKTLTKTIVAPPRLDDGLVEFAPGYGLLDAAGYAELERRFKSRQTQFRNAGQVLRDKGCFAQVESLYGLDTTVRVAHSTTTRNLVRMVGQDWRPAKLKANTERWKRIAMQGDVLDHLSGDSGSDVEVDESASLKVIDQNVVTTVDSSKAKRLKDKPIRKGSTKRQVNKTGTTAKVISKADAHDVAHLFSDEEHVLTHLSVDSSPEKPRKRRKGITLSQLSRDSDDDLSDVPLFQQAKRIRSSMKPATPLQKKQKVPSLSARKRIQVADDGDSD